MKYSPSKLETLIYLGEGGKVLKSMFNVPNTEMEKRFNVREQIFEDGLLLSHNAGIIRINAHMS